MTTQDLFNQCDRLVRNYPKGTCQLPLDYPISGRGFFPVVSGSFHTGTMSSMMAGERCRAVAQVEQRMVLAI
jgi:hypothetical protein